MVFLLGVVASACKEDGQGILVKGLSFEGVKAVSDKQLKSVLSTAASEKLPWGEKRYFSREEFEADLKRIEAVLLGQRVSGREGHRFRRQGK